VIHIQGSIRRPFEVSILTQLLALLTLHEILVCLVDRLPLHCDNDLVRCCFIGGRSAGTTRTAPATSLAKRHDPAQ